jgi:hypothetical protein
MGVATKGCDMSFPPPTTEQICSGDVDWEVLGFSVAHLDTGGPSALPLARLARGESAALHVTSRGAGAGGLCDDRITRVAWRADDPAVVEVAADGMRAIVTGRRVGQTPLTVEVTVRDGRTSEAPLFTSQRQPIFGIRVVP